MVRGDVLIHSCVFQIRSFRCGHSCARAGAGAGPPHQWPSPSETGFWVLDPPVLQGGVSSGNSGSGPWCSCHPLSWGITCEKLRPHQLCPPSPAAPTSPHLDPLPGFLHPFIELTISYQVHIIILQEPWEMWKLETQNK